MTGGIDFAALRLEREARQRQANPAPEAATPAPAAPAAPASEPGPAPASIRRRPDGADGIVPPVPKRLAGAGPAIYVGGALKDSSGNHYVRPPQVPADAVEVDCRSSGTEVKVRGNIASLSAGLGSLVDKKPETEQEKRLAFDFLLRNAAQVDLAIARGSSVWVHCAQGYNRGPSGLIAWLLLYTDATFEQACALVKAARPRARTTKNTFVSELQQLLVQRSKFKFADHTQFRIVDGGNDPSDDTRAAERAAAQGST